MQIRERTEGDVKSLRSMARHEPRAEQKDRLMAAALAIEQTETSEIQRVLGRSRGFVQRWAYAYRDGGIEALKEKKRGGSLAKIRGENLQKLKARIDGGPTKDDKVCRLGGKDIRRIVKDELGVDVSLNTVYHTLATLGYSYLVPRPRHEKQDLEEQRKFKEESAPFL